MNLPGKSLESKSKRELVDLLAVEIRGWKGNAPLEAAHRERVKALLALLGHCRLWVAERHWHSLCWLWLARSDRPDAWLRSHWHLTVYQWRHYIKECGFDADLAPEPPQPSARPLVKPEQKPRHLPFGFVRHWF